MRLLSLIFLLLPSLLMQAQVTPELEKSINSMIRQHQYKHGNPIIQVGVIRGEDQQKFYWGAEPESDVPDSLLMFELGATTKVFSAIILMGMVEDSLLSMDHSISQYLPDSIDNDKLDAITFAELASHTSGMMRYPYNLRYSQWNQDNLYRDYTVEDLHDFLERYSFQKPESSKKKKQCPYKYSDAGYGLLGHLMELASGKTYAELLQHYVIEPVGLEYTKVIGEDTANFATATNLNGEKVSNWSFQSMHATASLASNMDDMMRFVSAVLHAEVPDYFNKTMKLVSCTEMQYLRSGYGWHIFMANRKDPLVYTHAGNTGGYSSYIALNPGSMTAVTLLTNSNARVDQLGIDLLNLITGER